MSDLAIARADGYPVATPAAGVWLGTDGFEAAVGRVRADVVAMFADQTHRSMWAPPVIDASVVARTGYPDSFPHLLGGVSTSLDGATGLVLTPAACHHAYPLVADTVLSEPFCVAVEATCFRNEATSERGRLRSFRMREIVFVAEPEACLRWRDEALRRGRDWLARLGIAVTADKADDPFFGPGARLMRAVQREQQLKWELHAPVGEGLRQAVASSNYHKDHFSVAFSFRDADHRPLHSACVGFGLERIAFAFLTRYGPDVDAWPA